MFKVIATDVVISKGYDGAPALKFTESGESVRFRIGKKVYDTRAENNARWMNNYLGLATILKEVIQEAEHVELTACDDYDGAEYLLFEPLYPWQIREEERFLTEEKIAKLLRKYIQILSDSVLEIEHQSVENGG